ncbi:MAG TPA: phosphotransferase, partial [Thermoanaerobaculia bacterium]|nr:phosphotransferase [Thermoanaerobaculia bacterium]
MTFRQIDRFVVDVDSPEAVRYFNRSLRVPWSHTARLLTRFPFLTRFLGTPASRQEAPIVITDYPDSRRRRTIRILLPATIIKIRELAAEGPSLAIEAEACERVHPLLPRSTPRLIRFEQTNDSEVLVLSAVPGVSAYVGMQQAFVPSRLAARHFDAAARWLAEFRRVLPHASHGDFWAQNLLITDRGEAGVVDWERFEDEGPPDADLFHFPLTYGLNFRWRQGATAEEKFANTFLAHNRVSLAVR